MPFGFRAPRKTCSRLGLLSPGPINKKGRNRSQKRKTYNGSSSDLGSPPTREDSYIFDFPLKNTKKMMKLLAALLLCVLLAVAPASGVIRTRIERPQQAPYLARNPFTRALVMRKENTPLGSDWSRSIQLSRKKLDGKKAKKPPNFSHRLCKN